MDSKSATLKAFKSIRDPSTVNVDELVPQRRLPEWIGQFQKVRDSTDRGCWGHGLVCYGVSWSFV